MKAKWYAEDFPADRCLSCGAPRDADTHGARVHYAMADALGTFDNVVAWPLCGSRGCLVAALRGAADELERGLGGRERKTIGRGEAVGRMAMSLLRAGASSPKHGGDA